MQQGPDWQDLRYFLAAARGGTLAAAARALGVDRSTVLRRIGAIEKALAVKLFERTADGLALTEPGEEMLGIAQQVEDEMIALVRRVAGRDAPLTGSVRVATTDSIAYGVLPAHLARFHAAHPGIKVELMATPRLLQITRRDADVGFLPVRAPEGLVVGRKLCDMAAAIYGSRKYLADHKAPKTPADLAKHAIIASDDSLTHFPIMRWLKDNVPDSAIIYRTNSLLMQLAAVQAGVGLAYLPCFLGDPQPELVRALPDELAEVPPLWLVTHGDLRQAARIRAFMDFMADSIRTDRAFLEGRRRKSALAT